MCGGRLTGVDQIRICMPMLALTTCITTRGDGLGLQGFTETRRLGAGGDAPQCSFTTGSVSRRQYTAWKLRHRGWRINPTFLADTRVLCLCLCAHELKFSLLDSVMLPWVLSTCTNIS